MKFKLNKKKLKNLSNDNKTLPAEMTPHIAGGRWTDGPIFTVNHFTCTDCNP